MPFIPFVIGAVIGTAVTYVYKDDPSKQKLKDAGDKITGFGFCRPTNVFGKIIQIQRFVLYLLTIYLISTKYKNQQY